MSPATTQQFSGIFISYRRDDAAGHSGRLADRLVEHFGRERIFVDVDAIEPGEDFVTVIENAVSSCDILIAVIGRNWLSGSGSGRLDNPNDFVRLEVATALRRDIRVVPVLVQRATMPKPEDLPEDLVNLTRRNAVELTDLRWQTDVDQLIGVLEKVLAKRTEEKHVADEKQRRQEVEEKRRKDEQLLAAEKTKLPDERRNVDAELKEDEAAEEPHVAEAPVDQSNFADKEKRLDPPATIITPGPESPVYKHRHFAMVGGASLIVLLVASFLIWQSKTDPTSSSTTQAATPQPTLPTEATPAKSTPTPELKPSPPADPFAEPTLWKRSDTGTIVQIVRNGNTLSAIMNSPSDIARAAGRSAGDLAFKGVYEGRKIKGTAYLLFSDEDVKRCPDFRGEQKSKLELTLSEDGNTLTGSREDYVLSEDCIIESRPPKKLKYTRTSP